jgi:nitrate/nitrite transporter NarK
MKSPPWYFLLLLILAGESVFVVPFVLSRVFRPTVLQVFGLDNYQLGICFSILGIVAFFSYFLGGPLADKYPPRKLIATALWSTALGGLVYASYPGYTTMKILYAYWGFTTIFLFWAPMLKATRVWGGAHSQGKAFGFLDGGRGLVGALFGALGVYVFSFFLSTEIEYATLEETRSAFRQVIYISSAMVFLVGIFVWFFMKLDKQIEQEITLDKVRLHQLLEVLKLPSVWLLMIIILTAYVGYKITDIFSLYAQDVMHYDQVDAAKVGTFLLFVRPVVGVAVGFIADKTRITLMLILSFIISFIGSLLFATAIINQSSTLLFFLSVTILATGVYAARALYFAVMKKGKIPLLLTGTAIGLISLIGYTPDIFMGPMMGYLLERSPGPTGHQHVFWVLAAFTFAGSFAAYAYYWIYEKKK